MPLLVRAPAAPPPPPSSPANPRLLDLTWTSPDGELLALTHTGAGAGIRFLAGAQGFGAAPRAVTTQALATGGSYPRWSVADERLMALPLHFQAPTNDELLELRRTAARLMTATSPPAGVPRPGTLRVTRGDGTWREVGAYYLDGLTWADEWTLGPLLDRAVVQLVACDPFWYGPQTVALEFGLAAATSYLAPYETVSPDVTLGEATVTVLGDVPVDPVWTLTGPSDSTTLAYPGGPGLTFGAVAAGEVITIDVAAKTVTNAAGVNRIGGVSWPSSALFQLTPGDNLLDISLTGGVEGASGVSLSYRPRYETS